MKKRKVSLNAKEQLFTVALHLAKREGFETLILSIGLNLYMSINYPFAIQNSNWKQLPRLNSRIIVA